MPALQNKYFLPAHNQRGAALMLLLLLVSVGALAVFVSGLNRATVQLERDRITSEALARAKEALIGYTLSRVNAGERPGDLPYPDRLLTPTESPPSGGPPNYDGNTDSCLSIGSGVNKKMYCIGRLPWKNLFIPIAHPSESDPAGVMPWYVASANLIDVCLEKFNSNTLGWAYPGIYPATCPGTPVPGVLPHPWLTVRDAKGNVLSNRVAVLIIIPGPAMSNQSRPPSPNLAGESQYLDSVTVPSSCALPCIPGTYSNADLDNDFIMAGDSRLTPDQMDSFNDRLIYVTIEELMTAIGKRVAGEFALRLPHSYPDPVDLTAIVGWPAWFNDNNWLGSISYTKISDDKATASFSGCPGLAFSMEWSAANNKTETRWTGRC